MTCSFKLQIIPELGNLKGDTQTGKRGLLLVQYEPGIVSPEHGTFHRHDYHHSQTKAIKHLTPANEKIYAGKIVGQKIQHRILVQKDSTGGRYNIFVLTNGPSVSSVPATGSPETPSIASSISGFAKLTKSVWCSCISLPSGRLQGLPQC